MMKRTGRTPGWGARAAVLAVASMSLVACSDADKDKGEEAKSPEEVLAAAQAALEETSGLNLSLTSTDLAKDVTGLSKAVGVITRAPAFEGTLTVQLSQQEFEVPVISVDGTVWAQIPLTEGWSDVDPGDYGAPDPADLLSSDSGFASLLSVTDDATAGDTVRGGANNDEILTTYTGTVPGAAMEKVIPSSDDDAFDASYLVSETGELRQASFTGVFYPKSTPMTYTVDFEGYGVEQEITAP